MTRNAHRPEEEEEGIILPYLRRKEAIVRTRSAAVFKSRGRHRLDGSGGLLYHFQEKWIPGTVLKNQQTIEGLGAGTC